MSDKVFMSDVIWADLKNRKINYFGMLKTVSDTFTKMPVNCDTLFLKPSCSAAIASLDSILSEDELGNHVKNPKYILTTTDDGKVMVKLYQSPEQVASAVSFESVGSAGSIVVTPK